MLREVSLESPVSEPHVVAGPVLSDILSRASGGEGGSSRERFETLRWVLSECRGEQIISMIEAAGLRGRAGGGFPTALKWAQVARSDSGKERYFVCNLHSGQPGGLKERFLLHRCADCIIEAAAIGAHAVGAELAILYLGRFFEEEQRVLDGAVRRAEEAGLVGADSTGPRLLVYRSPGSYITGEETAMLELLEGRVGRPRGKPPLPTRSGYLGQPTVVNNLETVLQARFIVKFGAEKFRAVGTSYSPGTVILSLVGDLERPGLYEVEMGTTLRKIIFELAGGVAGRSVQAILPGGVSSRVLGPDSMDLPIDYDAMMNVDVDLGSGTIIVFSKNRSMVDFAEHLARFYRDYSCRKCQPCYDGTARVSRMLERLEDLDQKSADLAFRSRPPSPRKDRGLPVLNNTGEGPGGISYTDTVQGLDKIHHLAEWYKYRGDCHFSTEAARVIQSFLERFHDEFEERREGAIKAS